MSEVGLLAEEVGRVDVNFVVDFFGVLALFVGGGTTTTPADAYLEQGIFSTKYIRVCKFNPKASAASL